MQTRLVTIFGGSGFVGRHTVRALAKAGWRIRVAVRRPNQAFFLKTAGTVGQIAAFKCDVADPDQVAAALAGADAAVNLTGILYPHGGQGFDDVHVTGARNIAEAAARAGLRLLVHVSAIGADSESSSHYAQSKAAGEAQLRAAFPAAAILRPSIVFGPEDDFFNRFAGMARFTPALPLVSGGKTRFQPVFVGDVAAAIAATLSDSARGRTYELGGPTVYSFRELLQLVCQQIGRKRLLLPLPFGLALFKSFFLQLLPTPLLTPDQVRLLRYDNVVSPTALTLADLGITANSVEAKLPLYLWRYRSKGQYAVLEPQDAAPEKSG